VTDRYRVVLVCLGNICRSPMAEVVLRSMLADAGLEDRVEVSSAGTGDWHVGQGADRRTVTALAARGYDAGAHRARQFDKSWYDDHDLVIGLDRHNLAELRQLAAPDRRDEVVLLRSFDPAARPGDDLDVPDPYYGGAEGFDETLDLVERACRGLVDHIRRELDA
jgi:protein-tyrosine phosphatase